VTSTPSSRSAKERERLTPTERARRGRALRSDLAAGTPHSGLEVQCCGDAHLSNFGVFASPERQLVFDINDFDETHLGPWEWDVKRLASSMLIAEDGQANRQGAGQGAYARQHLVVLEADPGHRLPHERRTLLEQFQLTDFARKVVGVGSVGTRAWIALLLGSDGGDPLLLQMKEAERSVLEQYLKRSRFANHGRRVVTGQRLMQASSDIFLGWLRADRPLRPCALMPTANDSASALSWVAVSDAPAIEVHGLVKRFGEVCALDRVDLVAQRGQVLGLLGPNGAGKTTLVRVLATLLRADAGTATVLGLDVQRDAAALRERIGLAGQYAAVDENLTGLENLTMVGRLYGADRRSAKARGSELLERFELSEAASRPTKTYSGGMRRRLDLAAALVAKPPVLFLDEPTTGLDPRSRLSLWAVIEGLVAEGTTALLTTQYLDEADRLADMIAVIDHGRLIAEGTSDELKDRLGGERLEVRLEAGADLDAALQALAPMSDEPLAAEAGLVKVNVRGHAGAIVDAVRRLSDAGVGVDDLALRRPTLDDVFLALTGHAAEQPTENASGQREPERQGQETTV
jgi:ABC-2 type transport system ATP-binding protein